MSDIVERLRATQDDWPAALVKLELEAADEIERLRKVLRKIRKATYESDPYYGGADLEVREIVRAALGEGKE